MPYRWQLYLSPRPTQRTKSVQDTSILSADDNVLLDFLVLQGRRVVRETHYLGKKTVRDGKSGPPLHIHLRQKETFDVVQGVLGVVKNGVEHVIGKDDGPVAIEPGVRHTFWVHSSSTEDLVVNIWVEPDNLAHGFGESFMRNMNGYVGDCEKQKMAPSIFQIVLILYHSGMVITPPFWVPIWLLAVLHHFFGYWVGGMLLGYKTSYPEYSNLAK